MYYENCLETKIGTTVSGKQCSKLLIGAIAGKKVSKPSKETVVEKGDDFGNSKDDKIVSISAKSWDGSWPGGINFYI